jgi:CBS domain containing-hemolysin-like protein
MTRDEFAALATLGEQQGHLKAKESRILKNLLRLQSVTVQDIMTPRTVMLSLPEEMTISEVLSQHPQLPFSRLPIYGQTPEDMSGFVLKTDLLLNFAQAQGRQPLRSLKREMQALPNTASLSDAFDALLDQRAHLALVVDEYGAVTGLVTLEDLLETLLGLEIVDEADTTVDMQALAREQWKKRAERAGFDLSLIEPASTTDEGGLSNVDRSPEDSSSPEPIPAVSSPVKQ